MSLASLSQFAQQLKQDNPIMPVLFIGHGSPMNGIESNGFTDQWKKLGQELPVPQAVLVISAHWLTKGTHVTAMELPKTIHDFGGFPQALFDVQYPAPGSPEIAKITTDLVTMTDVGLDHDWGLDHGTWSVVKQMYPEANIPVLQLSIDYGQAPSYHYQLARQLGELRKKGVLIIGSGNMVHNLRAVAWDKINEPNFGFDWAHDMNAIFKQKISSRADQDMVDYLNLSPAARLAVPTPDHYYPLLYTLGVTKHQDNISFFNDQAVGGSLTMTSVRFG